MHIFLVTYDVATEDKAGEKRLKKVADICLDYGSRVQKSVFECTLKDKQYEQLLKRLLDCIDHEKDSLRIYRFTEAGRQNIQVFGAELYSNHERSEIIVI
ncbi:MAG: CRISPR-associated endoribonuclease Cas2 3 [Firmicutes bacterium]|nr:CRISPR-associated endoribonuclease Cas2 3 [Bacillota bacterium]